MFIESIYISGYKTLVNFKLENIKSTLNVFVGENNVGKSNILKALNLVFNEEGQLKENEIPQSFNDLITRNNNDIDYIDITFNNITTQFKKNINNSNLKNKAKIRIYLKEQRAYQYIDITNDKKYSINVNIKENFPKYIYFGDLSEKNFDVKTLTNIFPIENSEQKRKIQTSATQFLRNIFNNNIVVTINLKENNEYEIDVIDGHGNSNLYEDKSSGLQQLTYLALLFGINVSTESQNIILGIEEPEANLHTKLQKRLFQYIKRISEELKIQTFITTHSPVFIDKYESSSVYHVKRNINAHTYVLNDSYRNNWLSIRQDLGLAINDSLFIGDINLVVEGPTEKIIFPKIVDILFYKGKVNFNSENLNILSAQGANNTHYYSKIITQMGLPTCVVVDNDRDGLKAKKNIENDDDLNNVKVIVLEREEFDESEVEDIIPDKVILDSLNEVYKSNLTEEDLYSSRVNQHSDDKGLIKFSKSFKQLNIGDVSLSKLQLAKVIKNKIDKDKELKSLEEYFIKMDKFYSDYL